MDSATLTELHKRRMPHGVRMEWPMELLLPRVVDDNEEEPRELYCRFLRAVEAGVIPDDDLSVAREWHWVERWKEYAQIAFFAEAAARCYELLEPPEEGAKVAAHTRIAAATSAMGRLTGQSMADLIQPDGE